MSHDHAHTHSQNLVPAREEMRQRLREMGLRATRPRLAVLVQMHEHARPLSHPQIMELLGDKSFDRASVYRLSLIHISEPTRPY